MRKNVKLTLCGILFLAMGLILSGTNGCEGPTGPQGPPGPAPEPDWVPTWRVPEHFLTIQEAIDSSAVSDGHRIVVTEGEWYGATITKEVELVGEEGATIIDGPIVTQDLNSGFYFSGAEAGSGTTIRGFTFQDLALSIYSHWTNRVTVTDNIFLDSCQAITNWHGSGWRIHNNTIDGLWVSNGGGIGIFVGSRYGIPANGNFVDSNEVTADIEHDTLNYTVPGICLMSDARPGFKGGPVESNTLLENTVSVTSDVGPDLGELGVGIELTDYGWGPENLLPPRVIDNVLRLNVLDGSSVPLLLDPPELVEHNDIDVELPEVELTTLQVSLIRLPRPF